MIYTLFDRDTYDTVVSDIGHNRACRAAYEVAFYYMFSELPEDACEIEEVEDIGGSFIFIYTEHH